MDWGTVTPSPRHTPEHHSGGGGGGQTPDSALANSSGDALDNRPPANGDNLEICTSECDNTENSQHRTDNFDATSAHSAPLITDYLRNNGSGPDNNATCNSVKEGLDNRPVAANDLVDN
jgi:hypothetical protein